MPYYYSKAYSASGSSMGRRNGTSERLDVKLLHVERVPINSQGYDPGGAYWGTGRPLYVAWGEGPEYDAEYFVRAANRQEAKEAAAIVFPNAKFYR